MQITDKLINSAVRRKFIKPLEDGCEYNIKKLNIEKRVKHNETIGLLTQAHKTLLNVEYNLKNYNLVDASTLLRSSFEYIMMGMMLQFDEGIFDEFTRFGIKRDKTRICEIIGKFRTHMNEISKPLFEDINREEKKEILTDLYETLCNFIHSSLAVSSMIEIKNDKEKEVYQLLIYQNYYFLKLLLFLCLKHFTSDDKHYIDLNSISFTYLFLIITIGNKIKKANIDSNRFKDLLYYDKNVDYFEKEYRNIEKIKNEAIKLVDTIKENPTEFEIELEEFLK